MASHRAKQQENTRFQMLRLLAENPEMSTRQLASAIGISNGSAYYLLGALVQKGLIKFSTFTASKHKGRYAYVLTPSGLSEKVRLTACFLAQKRHEYNELKKEIAQIEEELVGEEGITFSA